MSYSTLLTDGRLLAIVLASSIGIFGPNAVPPALPSIATALTVPEARIGLVMSAFYLPSVVAVPASGVIADMYGRRRLVIGGLVLFGAAGTAIAFVHSFVPILVLRVVQGIGFAGVTPLAITVIGDLYAGPNGTAAQGMRMSAHGIVGIVVPVAAGVLASIAWEYPFLLYAAAFPVAVLVALYLPETAEPTEESAQHTSVADELRAYVTAIRSEGSLVLGLLLVGGFVVYMVKAAVVTFVSLYAVRSFETSAALAGGALSLLGATRLVVSPLAGGFVAYFSQRRALITALVVLVAGTVVVAAAPGSGWLFVGVAVYGTGDSLFQPVLNELITSSASEEHRAGVVSGLNVIKLSASWIGPVVFGLVLSGFGFPAMFGVAALLGLLYLAAMIPTLRQSMLAR